MFVKLVDAGKEDIYINTDLVLYFQKYNDLGCMIYLRNGRQIAVRGSESEIADKMNSQIRNGRAF